MNGKMPYDTISKFFEKKYGCRTQFKEMQNDITGELNDVIFEEGADVALFSMKDNRYVLLDSNGKEVEDDLIITVMNGEYVKYEKSGPVFDEKWLSLKYKGKDIDISEIIEFEKELYPHSFKFYVPILVHRNEPGQPWNSLNELEEENGAFYTDAISKAVKESMHSLGTCGLADNIDGVLRDRVVSLTADVAEQNGQLFGVMEFTYDRVLTIKEHELLYFWAYEEFTGAWSAEFEKQAIPVDDGELYVSFHNDIYDYKMETEEEFFANPHEQDFDMA